VEGILAAVEGHALFSLSRAEARVVGEHAESADEVELVAVVLDVFDGGEADGRARLGGVSIWWVIEVIGRAAKCVTIPLPSETYSS
jgi:hypothetical protein